MKKLISFVFPIYREEGNIEYLYSEMQKLLNEVNKKYDSEIIFINDGSTDKSLELLLNIQKNDKTVTVIDFSRNFGHQLAVTAGMDYTRGDAVIIMDADLQDPPKVCLELLQKWEDGYDVVYAQRRTRKDTAFKKLTAFLFYRTLDKFADIRIPKDTGDFRLMDRRVVNVINSCREKNRFLRGLVSWVGYKQTAVLFDREERHWGKTGYPLKKMIKFALDGLTGFSMAPIKLIMTSGILLIGFSIFVTFVLLVAKVIGVDLFFSFGHLVICSLILFSTGMQFVVMGILGEYIGRTYSEIQQRPLYILRQAYGKNSDIKA